MKFTNMNPGRVLTTLGLSLLLASTSQAAYVTPQMGGGQIGMMDGAGMKHVDITFDGTNLSAHIDETIATPVLRPLTGSDAFDPALAWSVLTDKAYNFQYAWNPGGFISLPTDAGIWIERLSHDTGLETYARPPASPAYAPLFESDGDIWRWTGSMTHNVYAVLDPTESSYSATYRVYIGDSTTGEALTAYGSDDVTLTFTATPVPEPTSLAFAALLPLLLRRRRA